MTRPACSSQRRAARAACSYHGDDRATDRGDRHSVATGSALRSGARNAPIPGVTSAAAHQGTHDAAAWAKVCATDAQTCCDLRDAFIPADNGDGKVAAMATRVAGIADRGDVPLSTCPLPNFVNHDLRYVAMPQRPPAPSTSWMTAVPRQSVPGTARARSFGLRPAPATACCASGRHERSSAS